MAKPSRPGQGERRICLPRDYTVVDTETTGLSTETCGLIEVSACGCGAGRWWGNSPPSFVPRGARYCGTGSGVRAMWTTSSRALRASPTRCWRRAPAHRSPAPGAGFLGEDLLLGHNVGFDAAFLYDSFQRYLNCPLKNDTLDHLAISRKLLPDLPHHRLGDVAAALGVPYEGAHRALADCWITYGCYEKLRAWRCPRARRRSSSSGLRRKSPQSPVIPACRATPSTKRLWCSPAAGYAPEPGGRAAGRGQGGERGGGRVDFVAIPAPGEKPLPGKEGGPSILPQGAFYRLLGQSQTP